ncbi:DMT family transporter [Halomonas sp. Y3]|uniref:DMT family transporter n=1 Tax=Halomonas sp. Y3 TaxID=2956797 RepID=UPI00209F4924|nr:DMT family transporter [Halomonas sp. Y3]
MSISNTQQISPDNSQDVQAYLLGFISVAAFAMTLPAAKALVGQLGSIEIGIFRSVLAAIPAVLILIFSKAKIPSFSQIKRLFLTSLGIVYGFPILTALGMQYVPVSHGGVMLAALPLSTAIFGTLITGTRPSYKFWVVAVLGFLVVFLYSVVYSGATGVYLGDIALLGAVVLAGFGYAQGGALSSEMSGWKVMCWTLVISLPILLPVSIYIYDNEAFISLSVNGMMALGFLAFINSLLGFFSWNRALALGGIQRISQLQLLQPFITFVFAIVLMGESWDWVTAIVCVVVVGLVYISKRV